MDGLNLQVMVNASGSSGARLTGQIEGVAASRYRNRFVMFTTLDLRNVGPGSGARIAAQLEADVKAGAVGVGEIMKGFGLSYRKADGTRLKLDDPELDAVWEAAARLKIPVFIHVGDPQEFFEPIDFQNERWLELALFPSRRYQDRSRFPSFEELMAERDRLLARHPNTTWVLAHLGWHANDLARLGRMFDRMPNLYAEVGAILYDLGRQPRTAREFFIKYQDRLLFGKDAFEPDEYPYYWRVFETNDEYFDYYRDYHAFWKLYGLGLPDSVLKKVYYANALKVVPGIPRGAFPK
jgi:predicted TIM-barrel fold metal-dependent hydrolase